jgi:hypothetical protein
MAKKQPKTLSQRELTKKTLGLLSDEELFFYYYLEELKEIGVVNNFNTKCKSFQLSPRVEYPFYTIKKTKKGTTSKEEFKTVLNEHVYTPDFEVDWNFRSPYIHYFVSGRLNQLRNPYTTYPINKEIPFYSLSPQPYMCIEVKPAFDHQGMQRLFSVNQKWIYHNHKIYVQKIIPQTLFEKTFTPKKVINDPDMIYKVGKNIGQSKIKWQIKTLEEFIK